MYSRFLFIISFLFCISFAVVAHPDSTLTKMKREYQIFLKKPAKEIIEEGQFDY